MGPKSAILSLWLVLAVNTVCCSSLEQQPRLRCEVNEIVHYRLDVAQQLWGDNQTTKVNVTADVDIICKSDSILAGGVNGLKYSLRIYHVVVTPLDSDGKEIKSTAKTVDDTSEESEDDESLGDDDDGEETQGRSNVILGLQYRPGSYPLDQKFSRPFYFIQLENGTILYVQHPHDEDRQVVNIKKSIAGLFQTHFSDGESVVEETDATSVHKAHYKGLKNGPDTLIVRKQINRDDVTRFSEGSGADPSNLSVEEEEETLYSNGEPQIMSGHIKASVATSTQANKDVDDEETEADADSAEYLSNSGLSDQLTVDQKFTLQLIERRKRRRTRSLLSAPLDSDRGLIKSTLISVASERETATTHLNYMRQHAPSPGRVMEAVRSDDTNVLEKTYDRFLMLLDLEGQCEFLRCYSDQETPIANALVHYFYECDYKTKIKLLSSLVASGTQIAQQALSDVLKSPGDHHVEQVAVLHSIAFLQRPLPETVETVRDLASSKDPNVRASALLAVGALARHSSDVISNSITHYLVQELTDVQRSDNTTERQFVQVVLHALSNTRNPKAASTLMDFMRQSTNEDTQTIAGLALKEYIELVTVVDNFTALLQSNDSVAEVAAAVLIDILTDKLIIQNPPAKIPHLQQLESTLYERTNGHHLRENYASRYFSLRREHGDRRAKRETTTVSNDDWAATHSQFNDIRALSDRRSDKSKYPLHKAYLYGKKFGVDQLHLRYTVGAFGGVNTADETGKVYAKAVAYGHAFGYTKEAAVIELKVLLKKTSVSYWPFIRLAGVVVLNRYKTWNLCGSNSVTLLPHRNVQLFRKRFSIPVLVTSLSFDVSVNVGYSVTGDYSICPASLKGAASITGDGAVTATGAVGLIELVWTVRAGIEVSANINYYVTPSATLQGSGLSRKACLEIHHGHKTASKVTIRAYYQLRSKVSFKWSLPPIEWRWGDRKTLIGKTWSLGSQTKNVLFSKCSNSYSSTRFSQW